MVDFDPILQGANVKLLPQQCRAARGLLKLTQSDLAEMAGVSRSTIKDFEAERHELHRATMVQLIDAFDRAGLELLSADCGGVGVRFRS